MVPTPIEVHELWHPAHSPTASQESLHGSQRAAPTKDADRAVRWAACSCGPGQAALIW